AIDERPDRTHEIARSGQLDLDDLGAEVTEQRRREWRADTRAEVEDTDAGERTHRRRLSRARAARSRCSRGAGNREISIDVAGAGALWGESVRAALSLFAVLLAIASTATPVVAAWPACPGGQFVVAGPPLVPGGAAADADTVSFSPTLLGVQS